MNRTAKYLPGPLQRFSTRTIKFDCARIKTVFRKRTDISIWGEGSPPRFPYMGVGPALGVGGRGSPHIHKEKREGFLHVYRYCT